uniref:Uncharacterized protein n=1 Tax=Aegilops tauschii subsp. strangulata TaxID=200361 RepID=A0A453AFU9_AEGTS
MPSPASRCMVLSPISFHVPTPMDPYVAGGTARRSGRSDWVLLHNSARISGHRNATTAGCHTTEGHPIEVSFWFVDPPGVSYFSVHCPGLSMDFQGEPYVHCAEAALVLFSITFLPVPGRRSIQHFVYRAGPGAPALDLIPDPDKIRRGDRYGLLPCGHDTELYAVVSLDRNFVAYDNPWRFDAHVFSSATRSWSSKMPLSCLSEDDQALLLKHGTCKPPIMVGASSLGWVDLFRGILLLSVDVLGDCPVVRYIQLPASRVCHMNERGLPYTAKQYCCDVSSCRDDNGGLIKFTELEFDEPDRRSRGGQGWRASMWDRTVTSDGWSQRFRVDVDNISVDRSYSGLLPQLWNDETGELQLKRLILCTPTLSKHDDDLLYVMAEVNSEDGKAWVITVDMKREAVEAISPYSTRGRKLASWHSPCTFPKYLDPTTRTGDHVATHSTKTISAADCVLQVLLTQDWFREIDERLQIERPTLVECLSLLQCCPVSSVLSDIQEVVKYAISTGEGEAAPKAVALCSRAFEDFDVQLRELLHDPASTAEGMRSKISVALRALDSILDIVPPTLRALADACHRKGGKTIFDLGEEPGDTEDLKLQCSPDASNLSHGNGKKPVHTNDRSYKFQQGGSNPNNRQWSKHSQALSKEASRDERAVVPDRRRLGRSRVKWLSGRYGFL